MTNNETNKAMKLKLFFRLLPVLGIILIAFGSYRAVVKTTIMDTLVLGPMILGVLLFLTLFVKAEIANLKYYLNVFLYSFFVMTICVVIYMATRQHVKQIDLTKSRFNSLSEQSEKVLKTMKGDVEIVAFTPQSVIYRQLQDLYASAGKKIKWTFIDPKQDPLAARKYGDKVRTGQVIVQCGAKKKQLSEQELRDPAGQENALTNALIEVTRQKDVKIYFLTGHGELALEAKASSSMMRQRRAAQEQEPTLEQFKKNLTSQALQSETLNLAEKNFVPEDAALVVIAGPQADIAAPEIAALEKYLNGEGKLLVTLDVPRSSVTASSYNNLKGLLKKYGVEVPDQIVLDLYGNKFANSPVHPMIAWLNPEQAVTADYAGRLFNFFLDQARPVKLATDIPTAYQVTELLKTSPESWAENFDVLTTGKASPPAQRAAQPVALAVSPAAPPPQPGMPAPPEPKGGMRMVVFGTSDLIGDAAQKSNQVAAALMMNSVNWLTQQEDLIAIPPKTVEGTPIVLNKQQQSVIFLLTMLLIPATLFFGGVSYSLLRRRR